MSVDGDSESGCKAAAAVPIATALLSLGGCSMAACLTCPSLDALLCPFTALPPKMTVKVCVNRLVDVLSLWCAYTWELHVLHYSTFVPLPFFGWPLAVSSSTPWPHPFFLRLEFVFVRVFVFAASADRIIRLLVHACLYSRLLAN